MPALPSDGAQAGQSYRCSICANNYPRTETYTVCPVCGEACTGYSNVHPMSEAAAESILAHAKFERYYAEEHTPDLELTDDEEILVELAVMNQRVEQLGDLHDTLQDAVH